MIACQDPASSSTAPVIEALRALGWVDMTALGVILVFFVLGLFKGLIWQVSRIVILVSAYFVAGQFGHDVAAMLGARPAPASPAGSVGDGTPAGPAENTVNHRSRHDVSSLEALRHGNLGKPVNRRDWLSQQVSLREFLPLLES